MPGVGPSGSLQQDKLCKLKRFCDLACRHYARRTDGHDSLIHKLDAFGIWPSAVPKEKSDVYLLCCEVERFDTIADI